MYTIAVIDDDASIGDMLAEVLETEGYNVVRAYSGTEALLLLKQTTPDLILLDLMMPGLSGEEVLPHLQGIPVIVLSAKVNISDKVNLLLSGAVDYLTKPFDIQELLARIKVQIRQMSSSIPSSSLTIGDLRLQSDTREITIGNTPVHLTPTEFAILKLLMEHPRQVLTKSVLLEGISEDTPDCVESSLKVHMSNLRKKLRDIGEKEYIESVWGIGFKLSDEILSIS